MQVKDIQPRTGKIDIVLDILEVEDAREFEKFGKTGKVANAKAKDETGEIKLTLWNEQADEVKAGTKVKITNGWASEYQGEIQLSTGKFGKLETVTGDEAPAEDEPVQLSDIPEVDEEKIE